MSRISAALPPRVASHAVPLEPLSSIVVTQSESVLVAVGVKAEDCDLGAQYALSTLLDIEKLSISIGKKERSTDQKAGPCHTNRVVLLYEGSPDVRGPPMMSMWDRGQRTTHRAGGKKAATRAKSQAYRADPHPSTLFPAYAAPSGFSAAQLFRTLRRATFPADPHLEDRPIILFKNFYRLEALFPRTSSTSLRLPRSIRYTQQFRQAIPRIHLQIPCSCWPVSAVGGTSRRTLARAFKHR